MCQKISFPDKYQAKEWEKQDRTVRKPGRSITPPKKRRAYYCRKCGRWCMTSMNKKEARAKGYET